MFEEEFGESSQQFYLGLGRISSWTDDTSPDTPTDTFNDIDIGHLWDDMLAAKEIPTTQIEAVTRRVDWTSGTVYKMYEHDNSSLFDQDFYVLTEDYNVYKCIQNGTVLTAGSASTVASTVKPDHTTPNTTPTESDGYRWRYMYTITSANLLKYLTPDWMPVLSHSNSAADTTAGSVKTVLVTAAGSASTVASTVKPDHTTQNTTPTESDGYSWRDMYTITSANLLKYLTPDWMPVLSNSNSAADTTAGSVKTVLVTAAGSGYTDGSISITVDSADGSNFAGTATVSSGAVTNFSITNEGQDYSQLSLSLSSGSGTGATFKPIIIPNPRLAAGGHGYALEEELGAFYRMLNVRLEYGESTTITTANDYRRLLLIKNPYTFGSTTIATATNYRQTQRLTIGSASGTFTADETITGGSSGATAKVVEWDSSSAYLYVTDSDVVEGVKSAWTNGETLTGGTSGVTGTYTAASVNNPGLQPQSGKILYVENRSPIARSSDQIEDIKLVIEF